MADTRQLWVCPNDSWEENASGCPLKSPCWPLTWKSHGRPRLFSRDARGLCFFRRGDLSSDHGSAFADAALSPSSLFLHIAPPLDTVESSLEEWPALLLSLFYLDRYFLAWSLLPLTWIFPPGLWLDVSLPVSPCMLLLLWCTEDTVLLMSFSCSWTVSPSTVYKIEFKVVC